MCVVHERILWGEKEKACLEADGGEANASLKTLGFVLSAVK